MNPPGPSRLSPSFLWEAPVALALIYLLLHPPMAYPQSLAVALGGALLLTLFHRVPQDSLARLGGPWWLFLAYVLISPFWSYVPGLSLQGVGMIFVGTLLYLWAAQQGEGSQGRLETWALALGVVAALWAFSQWAWGFDELKFQLPGLSKPDFQAVEKAIYYRRPMGPFATVGSLAAFLLLLIPIAWVKTRAQVGSKARLFWLVTLFFLGALVLTKSLGAWLSLSAAILTVLCLRRKWKWVGGVLGLGALGVGAILWARGFEHWSVSSLGMRSLLWGSAWKLFLQHPLLGTGLGTFDEAYQRAGFSLSQGGARYPHNLLLQLLCETGLLGTGLCLFALVGWVRRFKVPSRWEGWGVGVGVLAFLYFSLLDLPFQMPELVWAFAILLGRLELRPGTAVRLSEVPGICVKVVLLIVLGVTGLYPPFRPFNFAIFATVLWVAASFFQEKFQKVPVLFFLGGAYLFVRAFNSPSALGAVRCLEMVGLALAFSLFLKGIKDPQEFLKWFMGLGLLFGGVVWSYSFRSSDIRDWAIFPNPKQVGTFLVVGTLYWTGGGLEKGRWTKGVALFFTAATLVCLKAFGAMAAAVVGFFSTLVSRTRLVDFAGAAALLGVILYTRTWMFRDLDSSPTHWDRFDIWRAALKVWARAPWFGVGPGAFAGLFHQVKGPRTNGVGQFLMDAQFTHNEFLEFLTAFGILGGIFLVAFLVHLWALKPKRQGPALWALVTASFVDFCLHTPLMLLQGTGLLGGGKGKKEEWSWVSALLTGGVALGLFGAAAWAPRALEQAKVFEAQNQFPQALRCLEAAEKCNEWDSRFVEAKGEFLEKLYRATKDQAWGSAADEAYQRALDLEETDGQLYRRNAERLTGRLDIDPTPEAIQKAEFAWRSQVGPRLPRDVFVNFEEGFFYLKKGDREWAWREFLTAAEKEPNFAAAWVRSGLLFKERGDGKNALDCFQKAWDVHERWKDVTRIDPVEKELVSLTPEELAYLKKELKK